MQKFHEWKRRREKIRFARQLRQRMTPEETMLWEVLRGRKFHGMKFRRQAPVGPYIVDFLCIPNRLVVEVDGLFHQKENHAQYDQERTAYLRSRGFNVLRFTNQEVRESLPSILQTIASQPNAGQVFPITHPFRRID